MTNYYFHCLCPLLYCLPAGVEGGGGWGWCCGLYCSPFLISPQERLFMAAGLARRVVLTRPLA